eukprot:547735_1
MCRKVERFGNICASYIYKTEIKDEIKSNECGKSFMMFMIKQRWNWLRVCLLADEERNIYKTLMKGKHLKYSIWTGIKDNFEKLKSISINENRWEREFEERKQKIYEVYMNISN